MTTSPPYLYLAPIRGLTDTLLRNTLHSHFSGFDAAVAPFINPQKKALYEDKMLMDVLPGNNPDLHIVPQLLHTASDDFLVLAERLRSLGYKHINWNLGCPAPMVARKKRGSGLLPYPDLIIEMLEAIVPKLPDQMELSIKTRLGFYDFSELQQLLPRLNKYPLKEIIIHTRLGKQLYKGETFPDKFAKCLELSKHRLVYNGDITHLSTFLELSAKFPTVDGWMIGRGALGNPFLSEEIKSGDPTFLAPQKKIERLHDFHEDLLQQYEERLSGPGHILGRVKQLWSYLIASFPGQEKTLKKILKTKSIKKYRAHVEQLFTVSA